MEGRATLSRPPSCPLRSFHSPDQRRLKRSRAKCAKPKSLPPLPGQLKSMAARNQSFPSVVNLSSRFRSSINPRLCGARPAKASPKSKRKNQDLAGGDSCRHGFPPSAGHRLAKAGQYPGTPSAYAGMRSLECDPRRRTTLPRTAAFDRSSVYNLR